MKNLKLVTFICVILCSFSKCTDADSEEYVKLSASDKLDVLLHNMDATDHCPTNTNCKYPNDWVGILTGNNLILQTALNKTISLTFDRYSDTYPENRRKVIHTYGSVGAVKIVKNPDTKLMLGGLFEGAEYGVIRASLVKDPNSPCLGIPFTSGCFSPGIAVKMLRDDTYSGNLIAMDILGEGQGRDFNFFTHPMKTWVPKPTGMGAYVVMKIFGHAAEEPFHLDQKEFAADEEGNIPEGYYQPKNLYFVPNQELRASISSDDHEFRDDFSKIPVGTKLYDLVVPTNGGSCLCYGNPCEDPMTQCPSEIIASMFTTSKFYSSQFGDEKLFFQHERFVKKERRTCKKGTNADHELFHAHSAYRMSGNHDEMCQAYYDCPEETTQVAQRCPFAVMMEAKQQAVAVFYSGITIGAIAIASLLGVYVYKKKYNQQQQVGDNNISAIELDQSSFQVFN